MYPDSFDWQTWRAGSLHELGVTYKEGDIIASRRVVRQYAVGYLPGENLICRPKMGNTAVMFLVEGHFFWTHLTNKEFEIIFKEAPDVPE